MNAKEDRWKFEKVDIGLIDEAESNANKMTDSDFRSLCDNIGLSGMSSVPTCMKRSNGRFTMISGHHRLRAAKKLGYSRLGILYVEEAELSDDERIAIQLSHNSLHGKDDRNILKLLFSQIKEIDFKKFAHIDIDEIGSIQTGQLNFVPSKECYTVSFILYNESTEYFNELIGDIRELSRRSDVLILANDEDNEDFFMMLRKAVRDTFHIKSSSVTFAKILELASQQLKENKENTNTKTEKK